jgi:hypothetical protein
VAALREAQRADALAQEALQLAQADVSQWSRPGVTTGTGVDLTGMILGGILSGAAGGYRGHRGAGAASRRAASAARPAAAAGVAAVASDRWPAQ